MSAQIILLDIIALMFALIGFTMAFRQKFVRRLMGKEPVLDDGGEDPLTYVLRIAGIMLLAFSTALAAMITLFHFF